MWMGVTIRCRLLRRHPSRHPERRADSSAQSTLYGTARGVGGLGFGECLCGTHHTLFYRVWRGRDGGRSDGTEDGQARDKSSNHGSPDAECPKAVSAELEKERHANGKQRSEYRQPSSECENTPATNAPDSNFVLIPFLRYSSLARVNVRFLYRRPVMKWQGAPGCQGRWNTFVAEMECSLAALESSRRSWEYFR